MPYFWPDQFDAKVQAYGVFPAEAEVVATHGGIDDGLFVAHYLVGGRVTDVLGWNMAKQMRQDQQLIGPVE